MMGEIKSFGNDFFTIILYNRMNINFLTETAP